MVLCGRETHYLLGGCDMFDNVARDDPVESQCRYRKIGATVRSGSSGKRERSDQDPQRGRPQR